MRYVVKATCFFDNRYYKKGETVEFPSAVTLPPYFELIDKPTEKPIEKPKEEAEQPKKDEPKKSRMAKAKAKKNG